jgi:hypothetical protein
VCKKHFHAFCTPIIVSLPHAFALGLCQFPVSGQFPFSLTACPPGPLLAFLPGKADVKLNEEEKHGHLRTIPSVLDHHICNSSTRKSHDQFHSGERQEMDI